MTKEEATAIIEKMESDIARGSMGFVHQGISIQWEYLPKYAGGNFKRRSAWGKLTYLDVMKDKELSREELIATLEKPFEEREAEADLQKIKYCKFCGAVGIGEAELRWWGRLEYVKEISVFKIPRPGWADICRKCCNKILAGPQNIRR